MIWDGIFKYDEESPSCLVRDYDIPAVNQHGGNKTRKTKGLSTGRLSRRGYWEVSYKDFLYKAHRIVYEIHHGEIPEGSFIDHIDGNKSNNKIENLRLADSKINSRNSSRSSSNKTGFQGVYLIKEMGKVVGYRAGYTDLSKKGILKYFYFRQFNNDEELTFFLACEWRIQQLQLLNLQGAGYTDRHIYGERAYDSFYKLVVRCMS